MTKVVVAKQKPLIVLNLPKLPKLPKFLVRTMWYITKVTHLG